MVLLVAVVGALGGCGSSGSSDDGGDDNTEQAIGAMADRIDGVATPFLVPTGTVTVTVGDPVSSFSDAQAHAGDGRTAPPGSSYLPVGLTLDQSTAPWGGLLAGPPSTADVSLGVGSSSRTIGSPYTVEGRALALASVRTFFVLVPGTPSPSDLTLHVTYDGASQTAQPGTEPTGPGAVLASLPTQRPAAATCPSDAWQTLPAATAQVSCEVSFAGRTPYWPGSGWAAEGSSWTVAAIRRLEVLSVRDTDGKDYAVDAAEGLDATADLVAGGFGPTSLAGTVVLDESALTDGAVPLVLQLQVTPPGAFDPIDMRVSYDLSVA